MKINDRTITSASPVMPRGKTDHTFWDDDIPRFGLRLRLKPGSNRPASRVFIYRYWLGDRAYRLTLGKPPELSASAARKLITEPGGLASKLSQGLNPAKEKAANNCCR